MNKFKHYCSVVTDMIELAPVVVKTYQQQSKTHARCQIALFPLKTES